MEWKRPVCVGVRTKAISVPNVSGLIISHSFCALHLVGIQISDDVVFILKDLKQSIVENFKSFAAISLENV